MEDVEATSDLYLGEIKIWAPLGEALKRAFPFLTYTELAFSPNCMNGVHEQKHFQRTGNLPYEGYEQKARTDESAIFKKRFPSLKRAYLKVHGIGREKGEHEEVREYYFSLEEAVSGLVFSICPELGEIYKSIKSEREKGEIERHRFFAFLQYLRAFTNTVFLDYHLAKREEATFENIENFFRKRQQRPDLEEITRRIKKNPDLKNGEALLGSFRYLKNHFRSIYASLIKDNQSKILRETKEDLQTIDFPKIAIEDFNLYLLRAKASEVAGLSSKKGRELKGFLSNFDSFEEAINTSGLSFEEVYYYIYHKRKEDRSRRFFAKYDFSTTNMAKAINLAYANLAQGAREYGGEVVDLRGDYFMVKSEQPLAIDNLHLVRDVKEVGTYSVK